MKYTNPWYDKRNPVSRPYFEHNEKPVFEYRGVKIYDWCGVSWRYMYGDYCITERAGFKEEFAKPFIDDILDGTETSTDKYGAARCRKIIEQNEEI